MDIVDFYNNIDFQINELIENADGAMLTGSCASKTNTRGSDIDIVILSRNVNYIYSESLKNNMGIPTHIIFFPYYKVQFALIDDTFKGRGIYTSIFKEGNIIKDSPNTMLGRMQKYISGCYAFRNRQEELTLIHRISNNLESLSTDKHILEKIYVASEILLNISMLLTRSYIVDGKHSARNIISDKLDMSFIESYRIFVATNDASQFIRDVDTILAQFGGRQTKYTTGWVYTFPNSDNLTVFFPSHVLDSRILGYILSIENICKECYSYVFYVGKNQAMEEGVFLYLFTPYNNISKVYGKLNNYIVQNAYGCISQSVNISFPYKTYFQKGVLFGGRRNLCLFVPHFSEIWHCFLKQIKYNLGQEKNMAKVLSTLILCELSELVDKDRLKNVLKELFHKLLLDAVDPNGLYNVEQMDGFRNATLKLYSKSYENNKAEYKEIVQGIFNREFGGFTHTRNSIVQLYEIVCKMDNESLSFPDIFNVSDKYTILWTNVIEHLMSIFQLSPTEKFGIVYNYLRYRQEYVI